jgi:hypothetical protein
MISTSRRGLMAGALAVPTLAGLASWRWKHGEQALLLHDPTLVAGLRFADAAQGRSRAVRGDRVRFMHGELLSKPALVVGVTRHADQFLMADIAREHGYVEAAILHARQGRCMGNQCRPGWGALARLGNVAGAGWAEALAEYAINPGGDLSGAVAGRIAAADKGLVLGWVLAPRG